MERLPLFRLRSAQRMRLGIATQHISQHSHSSCTRIEDRPGRLGHSQDKLIQTDKRRLTEYEVKVLERFGQPEALTLIEFLRLGARWCRHVSNSRVSVLGSRRVGDGAEEAPCCVLQG
jgi:hypothetical protein